MKRTGFVSSALVAMRRFALWCQKPLKSSGTRISRLKEKITIKKNRWFVIVFLALLLVSVIALTFVIGFLGFFFFGGIYPTDAKIIDTLYENEEKLLGIDGFIGAGIRRNESNNHIIGIAVWVEENMTNIQEIPNELGGFEVFIKRTSEASGLERDKLIILNRGHPFIQQN